MMPNEARQAVREFLKLDLSQPKDIVFQDVMTWITIENDKSGHKPILIVNQAVLDSAPEELMDEIETMSKADGTGRTNHALTNNKATLQDRLERATVRSGVSENPQLQNLLWETASVGGVSKIPKHKAQTSRNVIKSMI
jgi:hypothetical protein